MSSSIDTKCVNAIRVLAADAVQKAKSGHPGLPLGSAAMAYELWAHHMHHNPKDTSWPNRDRFILSGGHGSTLLYSLLHLFGYGLTAEDLAGFRQEGSLTPGHPEYRHTRGVEATTGPLGAGMTMAVGMAIAEAHMASIFNKEGYPVVDHYTYALGGDGCMMEGITSEAFSLAGTLKLGKLIILYDSNKITIEGSTDIAFTEDTTKRFQSYGFQTLTVEDGNDLDAIAAAIEEAKADTTRPTLITVKTIIGYGCPAKQGTPAAHGEPLGEENVAALKENLGFPADKFFYAPEDVYAHYNELIEEQQTAYNEWNKLFDDYCKTYPEMKTLWDQYHDADIAKKLIDDDAFWAYEDEPAATRNLSGTMVNRIKDYLPNFMGGSADLAPSNKTNMTGAGDFSAEDRKGRNMHFGVREIAMGGIANGMALYGGLKPYVATFFVFSDYVKPMIRLASIMGLPISYVFSHDSIGVGEDGPTHEPVEQLAALRALPNFHIFRPADATETAAAWYSAITSKTTPTALALTRQNLPQLAGSSKEALKGAYVIADSDKAEPDAIIIASGSEVNVSIDAKALLARDGIDVRVVSMPCMDIFEEQSEEYKASVLPLSCRKRVGVEALCSFGWDRYIGLDGKLITMDQFGESAPYSVLFKKYGFTAENIAATVKSLF